MSDVQVIPPSAHEAVDLFAEELAPAGAPVLLLHGFLATPRALGPLSRRLQRDGFRVFSVELGGLFNTRRIDELAELVRDEVERIYLHHPELPRLTVIGHSQGGLVASWWVRRLGGHRRVRTLVTLGTPHRGTRLAWAGILLAWLMPSIVQMLPGSRFMRGLQGAAWPACVRLLSFYSRGDRVARWPSTLVDARGARIRNVEVAGGHSDYLLKKAVYRAIVAELPPPREAKQRLPASAPAPVAA